MSAILVSPPDLKVVAAVISVMVNVFSGMLLTCRSSYYNLSSNYIMEPYRKYYGGFY